MAAKYFIQQYSQHSYCHGGIGLVDAERILLTRGFQPILFPGQYRFSPGARIVRLFFLIKMFFTIRRGSVVVFIFPWYARIHGLLLGLLQLKGVDPVCIIADLEGLRNGDRRLMNTELSHLRRFRYFIVHNHKMQSYLREYFPQSIFTDLNFFDFLVSPVKTLRKKKNDIVFAGNLAKSSFLKKIDLLGMGVHFNVYGSGNEDILSGIANITQMGIFNPYELPSCIRGSFGLVWDGIGIDTCSGSYGEYLRYNSQHKLSLYIICGLPLIIWEQAAMAAFVKEYGIGFSVATLYEIEDKMKLITEEEYIQMQLNMKELAEKISAGTHLERALEELTGHLTKPVISDKYKL